MTDNGLSGLLRRLIEAEGPIGVADYMALALGHPTHGYYVTRDPLGTAGDFTTAPEISQMFGEMVGLWAGQVWLDRGAPAPVTLLELGPGRGTLMADALRALKAVPGFLDAATLRLVETSPVLRERQRAALAPSGLAVFWHEDLGEALRAEGGPLLVLANEFFDALPVRQYVKGKDLWHERLVGLDEAGALAFTLSPFPASLPDAPQAATGALWEQSPVREAVMEQMAAALADRTGAALIADYGYGESAPGETLQAVRGHTFHGVLDTPGEADLTAHVDFAALARAAGRGGARATPLREQGDFLLGLGIAARAETLSAKATPKQRADIASGLQRLTDAGEMGTLFKVLAVTDGGAPTPPCF